MVMTMTIWEMIKLNLDEQGKSINDLSKAIRPVNSSVLYALRDGRTTSPNFKSMVKITEALDMSLEEFRDCEM